MEQQPPGDQPRQPGDPGQGPSPGSDPGQGQGPSPGSDPGQGFPPPPAQQQPGYQPPSYDPHAQQQPQQQQQQPGFPPPPPPGGGYPPPGGYGPGYSAPGGAYAMAPPNDSMAVWSLVLSILGLFCCGIVLGPIGFFLGQSSLGRIRQSGGALGGAGLANAGRIIGAIDTLLWVVGVVIYIVAIAIGATRSAGT